MRLDSTVILKSNGRLKLTWFNGKFSCGMHGRRQGLCLPASRLTCLGRVSRAKELARVMGRGKVSFFSPGSPVLCRLWPWYPIQTSEPAGRLGLCYKLPCILSNKIVREVGYSFLKTPEADKIKTNEIELLFFELYFSGCFDFTARSVYSSICKINVISMVKLQNTFPVIY